MIDIGSVDTLHNLAVIVPTKNRQPFLKRTLQYYSRYWFTGELYVADSSDDHDVIEALLMDYPGDHWYNHFEPDVSLYQCLAHTLTQVTEPFCIFSGDDDFLVLAGIRRCLAHLEAHPELNGVFGHEMLFQLADKMAVYGPVAWAVKRRAPEFMHDIPIERWVAYVKYCLAPHYHVGRTAVWQSAFERPDYPSIGQLDEEFLTASLFVIAGKSQALDYVTIAKQINGVSAADRIDYFADTLRPQWAASVRRIEDRIIDGLCARKHDRGEMGRFVPALFAHYIGSFIMHQANAKLGLFLNGPAPAPEGIDSDWGGQCGDVIRALEGPP